MLRGGGSGRGSILGEGSYGTRMIKVNVVEAYFVRSRLINGEGGLFLFLDCSPCSQPSPTNNNALESTKVWRLKSP